MTINDCMWLLTIAFLRLYSCAMYIWWTWLIPLAQLYWVVLSLLLSLSVSMVRWLIAVSFFMVLNCFCWNPESFWKRGPCLFVPVFRCQHFPAFFLPQVLHSSFFPDNVLQTVFCLLVSSMLHLPEVVCLLASFASLSVFKMRFHFELSN